MAEEKREEGGRTCVQRELSSRAAACWFMFMFMFMLACWLVVVVFGLSLMLHPNHPQGGGRPPSGGIR